MANISNRLEDSVQHEAITTEPQTRRRAGKRSLSHVDLEPLDRATAHIHSLAPDGAISICLAWLRKRPDDIFAMEILARAYWQKGDFDAVIVIASKLMAINSREPGYLYLQGLAYQATTRYSQAKRALRRALALCDDSEFGAVVQSALNELDAWLAQMVTDLCAADPSFRRRCELDPVRACQEMGIEFPWNTMQAGTTRPNQPTWPSAIDRRQS